ncbi:MAG: hypothetical protein LLF89_08635 [Spirochaetaceae bacterium]|nr:hypothetical protein [Spirochaetaceae bacterium]
MREERVILEDHDRVAQMGRDIVDDTPVDENFALIDLIESRDRPEERGKASLGNFEGYIVESLEIPEFLVDAANHDMWVFHFV